MNKEKYFVSGAVFLGVAIACAVIFHFYSDDIKNMFSGNIPAEATVNVALDQTEIASNTDPFAFDDTSSSFDALSAPKIISKTLVKTKKLPVKNTSAAVQKEVAKTETKNVEVAIAATTTPEPIIEVSSSSLNISSNVPSPCLFPVNLPSSSKKLIFNEIAWMGSPSSSQAEWIEIKNISSAEIDLSGWKLMNATGKINLDLSEGGHIAGNALMVLSHGSALSSNLVNTGDTLALVEPGCAISDYLDASKGWPGGNNTTKQTLERNDNEIDWHTSATPGGTPDAENSVGVPPPQYKLQVAFEGDAPGIVKTDSLGLACTASCMGSFASGTSISLTPIAGSSSTFKGWSGLCYGQTVCTFIISGNTSLVATFRRVDPPVENPISTLQSASSTPTPTSAPTSTDQGFSLARPILIEAVQIAGASSTNDLVKLYNPGPNRLDIGGWKLRKRSQAGNEYSIKQFSTGSGVAAGSSFTWANSAGGFSEMIRADASSTETLSADNSIALMDANGNIIDALAWGSGTGQFGEGSPYPSSSSPGRLLARKSVNGTLVDTGNNAADFTIK